jgi:hypothetical protein
MEHLSDNLVGPVAWAHVTGLFGAGVLPPTFDGLTVASTGDAIHDIDGELLYRRVPLVRDGIPEAYVDVAVHPAMGHPFLAVGLGIWSGPDALRAAAARASEMGVEFDDVRLVAYSYPKLAAQFLMGGSEVLMLELFTTEPVPPEPRDHERPGDFQRWSLLGHLEEHAGENARIFSEQIEGFGRWFGELSEATEASAESVQALRALGVGLTVSAVLEWPRFVFGGSRDLHYSGRDSDHHTCYELRGQETSVWCVDASVQMMLDFYRYQYTQDRLAIPLGLGTSTNPTGLPFGDEYKVVDTLQSMTSAALTAAANSTPDFAQFETEINANRPLISFIPGHSRTVAGYWWTLFPWSAMHRGLLVYDPWPPNVGVITRYENYDTQTYRYTFTAAVTLTP